MPRRSLVGYEPDGRSVRKTAVDGSALKNPQSQRNASRAYPRRRPKGCTNELSCPCAAQTVMKQEGMNAAAVSDLLYRRSGLLGLSGVSNDMRTLEASPTPEAQEAIDYLVFRIRPAVSSAIVSYIGLNPETQAKMMRGEIVVELVSQGPLVERFLIGKPIRGDFALIAAPGRSCQQSRLLADGAQLQPDHGARRQGDDCRARAYRASGHDRLACAGDGR